MRSWREQSGRVNRPVALALGGHCCPSQGSPCPSISYCPSPRSSCGVLAVEKEPCCGRKLEQREAAKPNGDSPGDGTDNLDMDLSTVTSCLCKCKYITNPF